MTPVRTFNIMESLYDAPRSSRGRLHIMTKRDNAIQRLTDALNERHNTSLTVKQVENWLSPDTPTCAIEQNIAEVKYEPQLAVTPQDILELDEDSFSEYTVIGMHASNCQIFADHVHAASRSHAFRVCAAKEDFSDCDFICALDGFQNEGEHIDYAGSSPVDSDTILSEHEVYS